MRWTDDGHNREWEEACLLLSLWALVLGIAAVLYVSLRLLGVLP